MINQDDDPKKVYDPIEDGNAEVIAIAVKGATMNGVVPNEVIPISEVIMLAQEHGLLDNKSINVQL